MTIAIYDRIKTMAEVLLPQKITFGLRKWLKKPANTGVRINMADDCFAIKMAAPNAVIYKCV